MKLFLRIPTVDTCDREVTRWLVWLARELPDADIDLHFGNLGTTENRNQICELFLKSDCTHLWMLDSDVVPPRSLRLLQHDERCVNGIYEHYTPRGKAWDVWHRRDDDRYVPRPPSKWPAGLFLADAVGGGCMVLRRDLLEELAYPWFEIRYPNGTRLEPVGEDFCFCERLHAAGESVWIDPSYRCGHIKDLDLRLIP